MFKPGDYVRLKKSRYVHKGESKYGMPLKVVKQIRPNTYLLENGCMWNVQKLVPYEHTDGSLNVKSGTSSHGMHMTLCTEPEVNRQNDLMNVAQHNIYRPNRVRREPLWHRDYIMN